jgi:hypothetical protein
MVVMMIMAKMMMKDEEYGDDDGFSLALSHALAKNE